MKFIGYNTSKTIKYEYEGETYKEIFDALIEKGIIHYEEFENNIELKEDTDYKKAIGMCRGNAYYQEWVEDDEDKLNTLYAKLSIPNTAIVELFKQAKKYTDDELQRYIAEVGYEYWFDDFIEDEYDEKGSKEVNSILEKIFKAAH